MPPRLNKRQQREQEELLHLAGPSSAQDEHESREVSSSDEAPVTKPTPLGFAALAQSEVNAEDEEEDEEDIPQKASKKKSKKKKKKDTAANAVEAGASRHDVSQSSKLESRAVQKRGGKKEKVKGKAGKDEGDDLDKALAELSVKYPDLQHVARQSKGGGNAGARSIAEQQNMLLAVSLPHLDSEAEMRRFFGSKVISASKAQEKQPRGSRAAVQALKSHLTKPQPTWWSASQREGLSIRPLTADELETKENSSKVAIKEKGERWWTVEYSKRYRNVTKAFVGAVMSGDPERFYRILSKLPWHADTLLQMSEVYRHREEHSSSVDYLNRALFTYERSFIGAFTFTSGSNRLDFDRVENRPFYLAVGRMISDLQRRGCSRSAFEFARLLLSLDPYTDPHGALLYIDYLAIKAGMHDWLLSMWDLHDSTAKADREDDTWNKFNVTVLPGWSYARALALRAKEAAKKEGHEASTAALREAILAFPSVVPLLADKIDIFLPGELRGHSAFRVHVDASSLSGHDSLIHLLSHLYAHRSSPLWKIPENASWFKETAISVFEAYRANKKLHPLRERLVKQFGNKIDEYTGGAAAQDLIHSDLARSIYRHTGLLADANAARRLTAFFPRELLHAPSLSCDPLPPLTAVSAYDDQFFSGCEDIFAYRPRTRREREIDERMLARMIPDVNVRHQIQALYDGRPDIQRQFPDGVAQFAQVAAQLGEDFWDNLLPEFIGEADGGMPGRFEDVDNFTDDEDEGGGDWEQHVANDDNQHPVNTDDLVAQQRAVAPRVDSDQRDTTTREGEDEGDSDDDSEDEPTPMFPVRVWHNLVNRFWGGGGDVPTQDTADAGVDRPVGREQN
ncbi:DUF654-domain-containing protein [Phellopilus nigrolimitatus]|nr:DUF654-domain-containing protein [Phellopilus nigrolimitatus]